MTRTMLAYRAEMDLAATYALRHPALARECARAAHAAALAIDRADLAWTANDFLAALSTGA